MGKKVDETKTDKPEVTEAKPVRVITSHPAVRVFDAEKTFVGTTKCGGKNINNKYEIIWPIPADDKDCLTRYNCKISDLILKGIQQISHGPDFAALFAGKDILTIKEHKGLQELADAYKVGQRKTGGVTQKAKAQEAKKAEAEVGMTVTEMVARIKAIKAAEEAKK